MAKCYFVNDYKGCHRCADALALVDAFVDGPVECCAMMAGFVLGLHQAALHAPLRLHQPLPALTAVRCYAYSHKVCGLSKGIITLLCRVDHSCAAVAFAAAAAAESKLALKHYDVLRARHAHCRDVLNKAALLRRPKCYLSRGKLSHSCAAMFADISCGSAAAAFAGTC
jgi:hypothetical protein